MLPVVQTTEMGQWAWINASEHLQHGASGTNYSNGTMACINASEHLQHGASGTNYSNGTMGMD